MFILFAFFTTLFAPLIADSEPFPLETFPVILVPIERSLIISNLSTRVLEIPFKLGDSFKKGDIILLYDNTSFAASLKKTQKNLNKTLEDFKVKQMLHQDHLVSDLDVLEAEANLASAEYEYANAKQVFDESEIHAPFDGRVAAINIHRFEIPNHEKPVMEIFNDHILVANVLIPSHYLKDLRIGNPLYIFVNDTQEIVDAQVARISPVVNPSSSTVLIEAEIENQNGHLRSGMQSVAAFNKAAFQETDSSFKKILDDLKRTQEPELRKPS